MRVHVGADTCRHRTSLAAAAWWSLKARHLRARRSWSVNSQAVGPPGRGGADDRALFAVPTGRMQLDMSVRAADGSVLDTGAQDMEVPAIRGAGPVLLQPQMLRARTVRDFRTLVDQPDAAPSPARTFSRSERLLIRVPAYNPDGASVTASVVVSNMKGETIRSLDQVPLNGGAPQFDLPLAFLAPGEYGIDVKVTSPTGDRASIDPVQTCRMILKLFSKAEPWSYQLMRIVVGLVFACHGAQKLFGVLGADRAPLLPNEAPQGSLNSLAASSSRRASR